MRGTRRDDVRPGLRITSYRKRVVIAFAVDADQVQIIGIFYGGQTMRQSFKTRTNVSQLRHVPDPLCSPSG